MSTEKKHQKWANAHKALDAGEATPEDIVALEEEVIYELEMVTNQRQMLPQQRTITIFQWNMLADSLSDGFKNTDAKNTTWEHRKPLIIKILKECNSDIICLQECDKFDDLFAVMVQEYRCNFVKKHGDDKKDGVAVFVRRDKFKIEDTVPVRLGDKMSQVALIHQLSVDGFRFLLVATHLKSSEFENPGLDEKVFGKYHPSDKQLQTKEEAEKAERLRMEVFAKLRETQVKRIHREFGNLPVLPIVFVGDLNEERDGLALQYLYESGLESAYQNIKDCYTTYKKRDKKIKCIEEDYILFSKRHFKVVEILELPPKTEFLPNANYPSDHVFLMAKLCY